MVRMARRAAMCPGGRGASGAGRGAVAQPATISSAATTLADRVTRERREPDKMLWFFLEALVALLIAVAIVTWTMGPRRRKPPLDSPDNAPGDADRDKAP